MSVFTRRKARHTPAAVRAAKSAAEPALPQGLHAARDESRDATSPGFPAPDGDDTILFRVPGTGGGPGFTIPPGPPWAAAPGDELPPRIPGAAIPPAAVPALRTEPADPGMLREVRDALRALPHPEPPRPVAWLRALEHDGQHAVEVLAGAPAFAGLDTHPDGTPVAGMFLGIHDGGTWLVDAVDPAWCEDAITALTAMRDRLTASREQVEGGEAA